MPQHHSSSPRTANATPPPMQQLGCRSGDLRRLEGGDTTGEIEGFGLFRKSHPFREPLGPLGLGCAEAVSRFLYGSSHLLVGLCGCLAHLHQVGSQGAKDGHLLPVDRAARSSHSLRAARTAKGALVERRHKGIRHLELSLQKGPGSQYSSLCGIGQPRVFVVGRADPIRGRSCRGKDILRPFLAGAA